MFLAVDIWSWLCYACFIYFSSCCPLWALAKCSTSSVANSKPSVMAVRSLRSCSVGPNWVTKQWRCISSNGWKRMELGWYWTPGPNLVDLVLRGSTLYLIWGQNYLLVHICLVSFQKMINQSSIINKLLSNMTASET